MAQLARLLTIKERLAEHVSENRLGRFYETVLAELVAEGRLSLQSVFFDPNCWYEIDTLEDLSEAEGIFSSDDGPRMGRA